MDVITKFLKDRKFLFAVDRDSEHLFPADPENYVSGSCYILRTKYYVYDKWADKYLIGVNINSDTEHRNPLIKENMKNNYIVANELVLTIYDQKEYHELDNAFKTISDIEYKSSCINYKKILKPEFAEKAQERNEQREKHYEEIQKHLNALEDLGVHVEEMAETWLDCLRDDPDWYRKEFNKVTLHISYHKDTEFWKKMQEIFT